MKSLKDKGFRIDGSLIIHKDNPRYIYYEDVKEAVLDAKARNRRARINTKYNDLLNMSKRELVEYHLSYLQSEKRDLDLIFGEWKE